MNINLALGILIIVTNSIGFLYGCYAVDIA